MHWLFLEDLFISLQRRMGAQIVGDLKTTLSNQQRGQPRLRNTNY
jgi:hypothetical protein